MNPEAPSSAFDPRQLRDLFDAACELDGSAREKLLDRACAGQPALRAAVEKLLRADQEPGFDPLWRSSAAFVEARHMAVEASLPFERLGDYRILSRIGMGGMGAVYLAERDYDGVRRQVAIKIIPRALLDDEMLWRFHQERQILARLEHPNIAGMLDAGRTPDGMPYLVMDFVDGVPLDQYAASHQLELNGRLALIQAICGAVSYAHRNLVVHRDLKPQNILVTAEGVPKLLDFGIAKMMSAADLDAEGPATKTLLAMTPDYASPEQVRGMPISASSDIYSLGVILYELLAGRKPYSLASQSLEEIVRAVCEEDPTPPVSLNRALAGDLDAIIRKAMRKDAEQRYASVEEFSRDIARYMAGEPVSASGLSITYLARKYVARHKSQAAAIAVAAFLLVAGVAGVAVEAHIANRERDRASQEAATAEAVNDFLQNDLLAQAGATSQAGSGARPDPDLKVRTALDRAAAGIAQEFAKQPLVEASIRQTIGAAYMDLGIYPQAQPHLERSFDLRRRLLGPDHADTVSAMRDLARLYEDQGKYAQAEPLASRVLEIRRRSLGPEHPLTLTALNNLGLLYRFEGKFPQAETLLSQLVEIQRRTARQDDPATLWAMNTLGFVYQAEGKYPQADQILGKALEIRLRVSGPEHPATLIVTDNVAIVSYRLRRYAKAESLWEQNLAVRRRVLGEDHPDTLQTMNNLGVLYRTEGKWTQAETLLTTVLETKRRVLGEEHPETLISMLNLAGLYGDQRQYSKAEPRMTEAVNRESRALGPENPNTLAGKSSLARLYADEGKDPAAEALFTSILPVQVRVLGEMHPFTLDSRRRLGRLQLREHKYPGADATLQSALRGYEKAMPESWERYDCLSMLGASLAGRKHYAEAEPLLLSGYQGMVERAGTIPFKDRPAIQQAGQSIVQLYESWAKPEKAAEWRQTLKAK
jgi:tetratricopeptide (TPR) repeat protein